LRKRNVAGGLSALAAKALADECVRDMVNASESKLLAELRK
jgi:hypothetical protein